MTRYKKVKLKNKIEIILRKIIRADLDAIWLNFNEVIDEGTYLPTFEKVISDYEKRAWYHDLLDQGNLCLVAVDPSQKEPDNIVGQCTIENIQWEASEHVSVLGIIIKREYRDLGLGFHLMNYAIEEAKKIGKKKIILSTFANNESAIELYKKVGFKIVGRHKKHFYMNDEYIDEINMEIWIDN